MLDKGIYLTGILVLFGLHYLPTVRTFNLNDVVDDLDDEEPLENLGIEKSKFVPISLELFPSFIRGVARLFNKFFYSRIRNTK